MGKPLIESESRAMLTIIAAMASGGYRFVSTGNSTVPQEIADDAVKISLSIDVKTVRKYLKESRETDTARSYQESLIGKSRSASGSYQKSGLERITPASIIH